jgi:hypothetical protein
MNLPQVADTNTPRKTDVAGGIVLYDDSMLKIGKWFWEQKKVDSMMGLAGGCIK